MSDKIHYKVLLVEDNEDDKLILEDVLQEARGMQADLVWVKTVHEAIRYFDNHCVDIVLLDLSLPDVIGVEGIKAIIQESPATPVIVLTGNEDENVAAESIQVGAQDYLLKSKLDSDRLRRTIRYAVERTQIQADLKRANMQLQELAGKDPLTGMINRREFEQVLENVKAEKDRVGIPFQAMLIDADNFKDINDQHGHAIGDEAIRKIAHAINSAVRKSDYAARIGGDEFVVILVDTREAEAVVAAEKISNAVKAQKLFDIEGNLIPLTVSIGLSPIDNSSLTLSDILKDLDKSLKLSKNQGKDRISFLGVDGEDRLKTKLTDADGYFCLYQPILDMETQEPEGYEFFSRINLEESELPKVFFQLAAGFDILTQVDTVCFQKCLSFAHHFKREEKRVYFNIFPSTLMNVPAEELKDMVIKAGHSLDHASLEFSEKNIIGSSSYLLRPLKRVKKASFSLVLDDVSFNSKSMESLMLLEPDVVKIDMSCIQGVAQDISKERKLERLIKVVRSCDAEIIAKGIELPEDLEVIKKLGITLGQGYLLGKPRGFSGS